MAKGKYEYWLTPDGLLLLESWARDGLTDEQIAHNMGISKATLYNYKRDHLDILEALKKGKEVVDVQVENALLKRALGYAYTEITKERIVDTGQKKRHGGESELTERDWDFAVRYFGGRCCYCGDHDTAMTKDHIKPLNDGGTLTRDNVIPCCQTCNSSKKDHEMISWYRSQVFYDKYRLQKIYDYVQFIIDTEDATKEPEELVITKEVTKEVIPDTTAQIFWLKNRRPDTWGDKQKAIESQHRRSLDDARLELAMMKVELETSKRDPSDQDIEDDGFMDAMNSGAAEIWGDADE